MVSGGGGQTLFDSILNVTWLADADLAAKQSFQVSGINKDGSMDYPTALRWVHAMNALDHGKGYLGHNTWMLPTTPAFDPNCSSHNNKGGGWFGYGCLKSAMSSLYRQTLHLSAPDTAVPILGGKTGPFINFQPYLYWTDTAAAKTSQGFITFSFNTGWQGANVPKHNMYVLPMIRGNPFGTPAGGGGRLHPSADGKTVYDSGGDVTWLADANLAASQGFNIGGIDRDGSMQETTAVQWVGEMSKHRWLGKIGWTLPTAMPCSSHFNCTTSLLGGLYYGGLGYSQGQSVVALAHTTTGGFTDIQPYLYWSCAGDSVQGPCKGMPAPKFGWSFSFGNGFQGTDLQRNNLYVMVYYPAPLSGPPPVPHPPPRGGCGGTKCQ